MLKRFGSLAAMAILALVVLAACGGEEVDVDADVTRVSAVGAPEIEEISDDMASPETDDAEVASADGAGSTEAAEGAAGDDGAAAAEEVTVEMVDIDFNPNEFTIPANTDVAVTLPNEGAAVHNFNIDELDLHSDDITSGNSGEVTINADAGEYEYYCDIPGHEEAGMVGTLTVE